MSLRKARAKQASERPSKEDTKSVSQRVNKSTSSDLLTYKQTRHYLQKQITLPPELLARAEQHVFEAKQAGDRGMSFSGLVAKALEEYLG